MISKTEISKSYIEEQKAQHLCKSYKQLIGIIMTGANKEKSIGKSIMEDLQKHHVIHHYDADLRKRVNHVDLPVDVQALIMCHGFSWLNWIEDMPDDKIRETIDVNLYGTINMIKAFVNSSIHKGWRKKIIVIGSMAHNRVLNGSATYCASKAGVAHFVRCAAWELAPKGYDVYCIHPSNVDGTPMAQETIDGLARYRGMTQSEAKAYWSHDYIRGRSLNQLDIVALVKFLLTAEAEFLSGQQFEMTGGQR